MKPNIDAETDIIYRSCASEDREDLSGIHSEIFGHFEDKENPYFNRALDLGSILVAVHDRTIVGYAAYLPVSESGFRFRSGLLTSLYYAKGMIKRRKTMRLLERTRKRLGKGEVILEHFDSEFTGADFTVNPCDLNIALLGVRHDYRNRGIGKELMKGVIAIAKGEGKLAAYIRSFDAYIGFYTGIGFKPIVREGPYYPNGDPSTLMGMLLDRKLPDE